MMVTVELHGTIGDNNTNRCYVRKSAVLKQGEEMKKKSFCFLIMMVLLVRPAWAVSVADERKMAKEFMAAIQHQNQLIKDPMAVALVSEVGKRIVGQLSPQPFPFTFYIVDDAQFNAFAAPGNNIFVHRGLITALDNVDELAGILGHESAHALCRHVSQMVDRSRVVNMGTLAGVLAGVLVGAAGGGGDAGQAVAVGAMAVGQTSMLAYSRENETEADQKGLVLTRDARFSPRGLLTGLEKIRARDWYGSEKVPGYLKTHPGSRERIVYISAWLDKQGKEALPVDNGIEPLRFDMVKYRLAALYDDAEETLRTFTADLKKKPHDPALHYGMGIVLVRLGRLEESLAHLRLALDQALFNPYILVEIARIHLLAGRGEKALSVLEGLEKNPDVKTQALYYQARAHLMTGDIARAEAGLEKVVATAAAVFPRSYYFMADVAGRQGHTGASHYFLGRYYHESGDLRNAMVHLDKSVKLLPEGEQKKAARELLDRLRKDAREKEKS